MYLVDTSVWIDYINGVDAKHTKFLHEILANPLSVGISEHIYMEILQGTNNQQSFNRIVTFFVEQTFYLLHHQQQSYLAAANIYQMCRRNGNTIRSSVDCIIAQCSIENNVILLHNDRDFIAISNSYSKLKEVNFLSNTRH